MVISVYHKKSGLNSGFLRKFPERSKRGIHINYHIVLFLVKLIFSIFPLFRIDKV